MLRERAKQIRALMRAPVEAVSRLDSQSAQLTANAWSLLPPLNLNPLTAIGKRYWSQANEDGILEAILERTDSLSSGRFIELGVGDGTENNTIALLARGWDGLWIGGERLAFEPISSRRLEFRRAWITLRNLGHLIPSRFIDHADVISIDVDGNDYHFASILLRQGCRPKVWIVEYNGRFAVGTDWIMPYDEDHRWDGSDYFGASLTAFVQLFRNFGYQLVACSAQGANAFFVDVRFEAAFRDVPRDEALLYRPPAYFLSSQWGHHRSPAVVRSLTQDAKQTSAIGEAEPPSSGKKAPRQ